jgi:hypothetical protein
MSLISPSLKFIHAHGPLHVSKQVTKAAKECVQNTLGTAENVVNGVAAGAAFVSPKFIGLKNPLDKQ